MTPQSASASGAPSAGMNDFVRLFGVFFEPSKTFADIANRPSWLLPLVVGIVISMGLTYLYGQRVGWERIVRNQVEASSAAQQLTPEQLTQRVEAGAKIAPIIGYVAPAIVAPLYCLLAAAIFMGLVSGVMSAPVKFKQVFAVVAFGGMPNVIVAILSGITVFLKDPDQIDPQNPLVFNLGAFLDAEHSSKFLHSFATSMDLFSFWTILLLATGLKAAAGKKLSFGGALFAVVIPWGGYVLIKSTLAMVFG